MTTVLLSDGRLRAPLSEEPGITVVASSGHDVVRETLLHRPDVVVLAPELGVVEALHRAAPQTAVLVLSASTASGQVAAAIRAGARGYLLADAAPSDVARAVRALAAGQMIFGKPVAAQVTRMLADRDPVHPFGDLTERERQVLALIAAGHTNASIAHRLRVSPKTVGNHVSVILGKLAVADRAQAITMARAAGLVRA